ncbi:MAG: SEL1-like repeat protein [Candidatus Methanomethylophilaceae archaeon]|nr:SEL1-like repeat protein [Candidatus Methanomethylophilaceae archaeon]
MLLDDLRFEGNYDEFVDRVRGSGSALGNSKKLLSADNGLRSLDELSLDDGRQSITVDSVEFKCLFKRGSSDRLCVFLNGAVVTQKKLFQRWSWNVVDNVLVIADPMNTEHGLVLGWYYGTVEKDYRRLTADIVMRYASLLGIPSKNIVVYGSSGGGCAAIYVGSYLGDVTVVSINPQIDIKNWNQDYVVLQRRMGLSVDDPILKERNDPASAIDRSPSTKFLIIFNILSKPDFDNMVGLDRSLGIGIRYGHSGRGNVHYWAFSADSVKVRNRWTYHNAQETHSLYFSIDSVVRQLMESGTIPDERVLEINLLWEGLFEGIHLKDAVSDDPGSMYLVSESYRLSGDQRYTKWLLRSALGGDQRALSSVLRREISLSNDEEVELESHLLDSIGGSEISDAILSVGARDLRVFMDESLAEKAVQMLLDADESRDDLVAYCDRYDYKKYPTVMNQGFRILVLKDDPEDAGLLEQRRSTGMLDSISLYRYSRYLMRRNSPEKAEVALEESRRLGYWRAEVALTDICLRRGDVAKLESMASSPLRRSKGHLYFVLALAYRAGHGVEADEQRAEFYLNLAADLGDEDALISLDDRGAMDEWLKKALSQ